MGLTFSNLGFFGQEQKPKGEKSKKTKGEREIYQEFVFSCIGKERVVTEDDFFF